MARLRIEANFIPVFEFDTSTETAGKNPLLTFLQPKISGDIGYIPVNYAPYGEPNPQLWGIVKLIIIGLGLFTLLFWITRRG